MTVCVTIVCEFACLCMRACVHAGVYVCVCVCVRETERERERARVHVFALYTQLASFD